MTDWREISVALEGTHHVRRGVALYAERFDAVLLFHAPGLAPVRKDGRAWHVDIGGRAAYARRFVRTFGFYEGRAAVEADDGCHHILEDGADSYGARFSWCGNYQRGFAPARTGASEYLHLDLGGEPLYAQRWRYAGDFRDGAAVVQRVDGRSTHIDSSGAFLHATWFLDLDVFHKGFARARDADGWMHIDRRGCAAYRRRFLSVEPFYNGQARVERFDGGIDVIDETGRTLVELRPCVPQPVG